MTRRDLLNDNADLMGRAARLIRQQPSYQLSLKPVNGEGPTTVVVGAASKVPSSKAARRIARVDMYANGRPVVSVDAAAGTVPPTEVVIARQPNTRVVVEAQAWDQNRRLVAVRRISLR